MQDGIAIVVSKYWVSARPEEIRRQLQAAGFGFGYADVVGGLAVFRWNSMPKVS
jgi:hypothetical protein